MDKILITGGTSFVGHWLKICKPKDIDVYCLGRASFDEMKWAGSKWDAIIHLAPIAPTLVLEYALTHKCRVLYASSGAVYHPENIVRKEYREDKIKYEKECLDSGADVVIARLFTFSGAKLDNNKAIVTFTEAAQNNQPLIITGDGFTVRSYMHGSDMARWMWTILMRGRSGESYDVGSDDPINMFHLAHDIIKLNNSKSQIIILGGKDPMPYYVPTETAKTKALLKD